MNCLCGGQYLGININQYQNMLRGTFFSKEMALLLTLKINVRDWNSLAIVIVQKVRLPADSLLGY